MTRVFEIKLLEEEKRKDLDTFALDSPFDHPRRYCFMNCWLRREEGNRKGLTPCGGEGIFEFEDGYCPEFMGRGKAWVVQEVDGNRFKEPDRFIKAD